MLKGRRKVMDGLSSWSREASLLRLHHITDEKHEVELICHGDEPMVLKLGTLVSKREASKSRGFDLGNASEIMHSPSFRRGLTYSARYEAILELVGRRSQHLKDHVCIEIQFLQA